MVHDCLRQAARGDLTAAPINAAAQALLGPHWTKAQLARELGWDLRRVQRWCAGHELPPDFVWHRIRTLLRERHAALVSAIVELDGDSRTARAS